MRAIHPILLCGGSGTRLWPVSRQSYPKQFARLLDEESLFQRAVRRVAGEGFSAPLVATAEPFRFIVLEQMAGVEAAASDILLEPEPRNTAAAVAAATLLLHARAPEALALVLPSDHVISDADGFRGAVDAARPAAEAGRIVTFGVAPDRAETGYGWIETAPEHAGGAPVSVRSFVEKPDAATAEEFLAGGRHLWNAGIFLFATSTMIDALTRHAPRTLEAAREALEESRCDLGFRRLAPGPWGRAEPVSLDRAVMEKTDSLRVMPMPGRWSDLGDWNAVLRERSEGGETVATGGSATAIDCRDTLLHADSAAQELVGIGLEDVIAVAMPDAVLVAHKSRSQEVGRAVAALREKSAPQADRHPRDHRPWGWFECLAAGSRFQVKRIRVNPGAALSLQSHHHRAEHWVVVEGTAEVTIGEAVMLVSENESVYIPLGTLHRLRNPGKLPLTLIEVQTGGYLGEDDIVRYEDVYARPVAE